MWLLPTASLIVHLVALAETAVIKDYGTTNANLENKVRDFLAYYEVIASCNANKEINASWNYETDINDKTTKMLEKVQMESAAFYKEIWKNASHMNWKSLTDANLKRQFKQFSIIGVTILNDTELKEYNNAITNMETIYATTKICSYHEPTKCELHLDPEITEIMAKSRNYDELLHVWKEWHTKAGNPMRPIFPRYVELGNKASVLNGLKNLGELWKMPYESKTFANDVATLWGQLKPFYQQLHAYVRRKLRLFYGDYAVPKNKPIPAHLFGNMWAQSWSNIYNLTVPFPNKIGVDVTNTMVAKGYTVLKMFQIADEFFESLGLIPLPEIFWKKSMFDRPENREVVCHASAWDFQNGKDFRIKMCTAINMDDLFTIHHEMGHIQYFMQYKDQPFLYREGANPGFHEAVGDTLALSVSTPKHLNRIGLLDEAENDYESDINYLLKMALDKIAFLPFAYAIDLWRWKIFEGEITEENYNREWWKLRRSLQGIVPPVRRKKTNFDAGAKIHVAAAYPYIRYFVSFVIQFQFYKAMCLEAGQYVPGDDSKPLHNCDFYRNKDAGTILSAMLSMGSSLPWPEAMNVITKGETKEMDASALVEYFKPLLDFLKAENEKHNEPIGW